MEEKRDPVADRKLLRNARREAWIVFTVWGLSLLWVVGYCFLRGYSHDPDSWLVRVGLARPPGAVPSGAILGFPDWVFWGIMVPWLICSAFTVWFGLSWMKDDDLGREKEEEGAGHGH